MDVIATGNYTNGEKEGLWEYYQSLLYWKGIYKNGKKEGVWNFYDREIANTGLIIKGIFTNGLAEGEWEYFYNDDETGGNFLAAKGKMHQGNLTGIWETYHWGTKDLCSTGMILKDSTANDTTKQFDVFTFLHDMYQLSQSENDQDINKSGNWIYYHLEKKIQANGLYVKGKKEGIWTYYYENGNTWKKGKYINNRKTSEWYSFDYQNNKLNRIETFVNDTLNGYCKYICNKYNSSMQELFSMGKPTGEWQQYYNDSILIAVGAYDGLYYPNYQDLGYYSETCELFKKNKHGYWKTYYDNGLIKEEGEYVHGEKTGQWRTYASLGYLNSIEHYKNNELHGEYVYFNWYGKYVWHHGCFENGKKQCGLNTKKKKLLAKMNISKIKSRKKTEKNVLLLINKRKNI